MEDGFKRDVSEFNSSIAYLNRINYHFAMCAEAKEEKNPFKWLDSLIIIYSELSTEMQDEEKDNFFKKIEKYNTDIYGLDLSQGSIPWSMFKNILLLELELRRIFKESGLQQKIENDATKALK